MDVMPSQASVPHLSQLTPYHVFDPSGSQPVRTMRFHGSQRLNLMRPTRMPASSRRYTLGDPVQLIDWRAFARTEQLVIREHFDEASCRVRILIDDSPTLSWPDPRLLKAIGRQLCTKRELSWRLALHLCYQYLKAGDHVKLYRLQQEDLQQVIVRSPTELAIHFEQLQKDGFQNFAKLPMEARSLPAMQTERSDVFIWISDGLNGIPPWLLEKKGPMTSWIHALSSLEADVNWMRTDDSYFEEAPVHREYLGDILLEKQHLQRGIAQWMESMQNQWLKVHRHYLQVHDASSIQRYLFHLEQSWHTAQAALTGERIG
jgi:hypothetical protein